MKVILKIIIILAIFPINAFSQWAIMTEEADSLVKLGTYYVYNVKFDAAEDTFEEVIDKYPDHPVGYFLAAMVDWWKTKLFSNNEKYNRKFIDKITKVIEVSDELLKKNEKDINALFFKAGALGYRGRFYAERESWLKAASDGAEAFNLLQECRKIAPNNHDIMLGTGLYNYFAKVIPEKYPITKPMLSFLPRGDKSMGLYQLRAAANHARYADIEALVVLLQVYYNFEKDNDKSLEYSSLLHEKYPDNPYFHKYYGRSLVRKGKTSEFEAVFRDIILKSMDKMPGYDVSVARESLYYVGNALYNTRNYEMALKYFKKCDEASRLIDKDSESGFMINANLYIAMIYDKLGKKDMAKKVYQSVLTMKEYDSSHAKAKKYLSNN